MCTDIGSFVRESQVDLTNEFDAIARTAARITELFFWNSKIPLLAYLQCTLVFRTACVMLHYACTLTCIQYISGRVENYKSSQNQMSQCFSMVFDV